MVEAKRKGYCFIHSFTEEDYTNRIADHLVRRLKRDEIGVCVFPSKHARCVSSHQAADKPESERSKRKVRYFSASVSLPVIFCSLTLVKTSVFSCKCNNCDTVFIREMERCNGKFSASTGSVQVLISLSRSVFSTAVHTKQNQSRLLIDVSGPVEASKGVSSCPRVGLIQWQLF